MVGEVNPLEDNLNLDWELQPVRCPNCRRKLEEGLTGKLLAWCRHCKQTSLIVSRPEVAITR